MGVETLLALSIGAGVAGAGLSAAGSIKKGEAAQQAANYNAAVDAQRAAEEKDQAAADAQDYLRKGSDTVATAETLQNASGVTSQGSPLMVDENTVRQVALGASRTLQGGDLRASRLQDDAQLKKMEGQNAVTASYLDAGSSLLTATSKFANPNFGRASV